MAKIPKSLKIWFLIHFIVDFIFAIPLILFPSWILGLFGLEAELIFTRLVGAALLGIGGTSFLMRNKSKESYNTMLNLKLIWSVSAILALILSIFTGAPKTIYIILGIFIIFSAIWIYYKIKYFD
jgi:cation transport ATPase